MVYIMVESFHSAFLLQTHHQAVEQSNFQCGRGLISSTEHRNLLPVMLEEDSWQYKAPRAMGHGRFKVT